ncbi:MAG: hypothetical protein GEU80_04010 [Dehalococcoidia bacterium]|nr:hypothetical protein [Dehalococcoidia bacterium]
MAGSDGRNMSTESGAVAMRAMSSAPTARPGARTGETSGSLIERLCVAGRSRATGPAHPPDGAVAVRSHAFHPLTVERTVHSSASRLLSSVRASVLPKSAVSVLNLSALHQRPRGVPMTRRTAVAGGSAALMLVLALFAAWWLFIRDDSPPPVSLEDAVSSVAGATSTAAGTTEELAAPSSGRADGDVRGAWAVDPEGSFVGYRVQEELARVGATTAVGRTSDVAGRLEFDGNAIMAVEVTADLTTLTSDESRRDRALREQALETDQFPQATFVLAQPVALDAVPADGEQIAVTAVGDLTLHGVTRRIELPLQGHMTDGAVVVVGSTELMFADYDMEPPRAQLVLSVDDRGTLEFQLVFRPA